MTNAPPPRVNASHAASTESVGAGNASAFVSGIGSSAVRQSQSVPSATNATARSAGAFTGSVVGAGVIVASTAVGNGAAVGVTSGGGTVHAVAKAATAASVISPVWIVNFVDRIDIAASIITRDVS